MEGEPVLKQAIITQKECQKECQRGKKSGGGRGSEEKDLLKTG
jgi:hypothetical protein